MTRLNDALRVMGQLIPSAIELRQALHADPELGGTEKRTAERLLDHLAPVDATRVAEGFLCRTGVGRPAHGAYPQRSRDPIVAAAQLVGALQTLISRESDPRRRAWSPSAGSTAVTR